MKRVAWMGLIPLLAACSGNRVEDPDEGSTSGSADKRIDIDREHYDSVKTSDLNTNRTRGISKTIEWQDFSTPEDEAYLGGNIVVDKIFRDDADDFFGVRIRVGNKTTGRLKVEVRIRFYDTSGRPLIGLHDQFRSLVVQPRGLAETRNACRIRGAVGFRVFVRRTGTTEVGNPDRTVTKKEDESGS